MKDKTSKSKKVILTIMLFLIIGLLTAGLTAAYFAWSSTGEDKDATLSVSSIDKSNSICEKVADRNPKLIPVANRNGGRIVKLNAKQTLSEYASITWTLTINSINKAGTETNGLKHQTFKYEMINVTSGVTYGSGNFEGLDVGSTISFSNNTENLAYNKDYNFILYLWIDGEMGRNPLDMADQTYSFDLVCDMTGESENKLQENYLMVQTDTGIFGKDIDRSKVKTVTTLASKEVPQDIPANQQWIVSENGDNSVVAWYTVDENDDYDLYIGQNGGVIANPNSKSLFSSFTNVTKIDLSNFITSNVTSMQSMFFDCENLESIDFGNNFNTSKVTNMLYMFYNNKKLTNLADIGKFDVSNVTNMGGMFSRCSGLETLDGLENWNVSKVVKFSYEEKNVHYGMFENCTSLTDASAINDWNIMSTAIFTEMFKDSNNVHPTFSRIQGTWDNNGTFISNA